MNIRLCFPAQCFPALCFSALCFRAPWAWALIIAGWCVSPAWATFPGDPTERLLSFDDLGLTGNPDVPTLSIGDVEIHAEYLHVVNEPSGGGAALVDNGSTYLAQQGGGIGRPITLRLTADAPFSLLSFDAGEGFVDEALAAAEGYPNSVRILVEGMQRDGGTTAAMFTLDGLKDGPGGVADFQSFLLPASFADLTLITFSGQATTGWGAIALDNIRLSTPIPEPSSAVALMTGMVAAVARTRKRKSIVR